MEKEVHHVHAYTRNKISQDVWSQVQHTNYIQQ